MSDDVTTQAAEEQTSPAARPRRSRRATAPATTPAETQAAGTQVAETTVGGASVGETGTLAAATVTAHRRGIETEETQSAGSGDNAGDDAPPAELLDVDDAHSEDSRTEDVSVQDVQDEDLHEEDVQEDAAQDDIVQDDVQDDDAQEDDAQEDPQEEPGASAEDALDVFAEVDRFRESGETAPRSRSRRATATTPMQAGDEADSSPAEDTNQDTSRDESTTPPGRAAQLDVLAAFSSPAMPDQSSVGTRRRSARARDEERARQAPSEDASQEPSGTAESSEQEDQREQTRLPVATLLFQAPEPRRPRRAQAPAQAPEDSTQDDEQTEEGEEPSQEASQRPSGARARGGRRAQGGGSEADQRAARDEDDAEDQDSGEDSDQESAEEENDASSRRRRRRGGRGRGRRPSDNQDDSGEQDDSAEQDDSDKGDDSDSDGSSDDDDNDTDDNAQERSTSNRRRGRRRRGRGTRNRDDAEDRSGSGSDDDSDDDSPDDDDSDGDTESGASSSRRRRRRRRSGVDEGGARARAEVTALKGSTRLEAKRQRRREGREAGRRRPLITEAEFLARRESVERSMVVREQDGLNQIAVLEDGMLVEHYVARHSQTSMVGNVYLGRVQNVLPSMEAAFIDIGKGRNAVLYAGEVNWDAAGMSGQPRRIEQALKSGDAVMVQVTKDPIGHKGARLTSQITLAGRYLVLVPSGAMTGISRKLPDGERNRLKRILKQIVPSDAGVIVRTAAEGASEQQLAEDIERLTKRWDDIQRKAKNTKAAPTLLQGEPELAVRVVRDVFNEDFVSLKVAGDQAWDTISSYVSELSPDLADRMHHWTDRTDIFSAHRVDEQLAKGMDRKVWLPSGGSLVIDRTEAMTVVDVNTGKFTGAGGTLEETVTKNNLEAAEEIVRQLRLRDIGGIIVIDFIDMVLESNRDLVLRRLIECLGRDRTRHQVAEVTSLGLVQMTRKRVGQGLVEAFSTACESCSGRGFIVHDHPVETDLGGQDNSDAGRRKSRRGGQNRKTENTAPKSPAPAPEEDEASQAAREAVKATLATIAAAAAHAHDAQEEDGDQATSTVSASDAAVDRAAADVVAAVEKVVAEASVTEEAPQGDDPERSAKQSGRRSGKSGSGKTGNGKSGNGESGNGKSGRASNKNAAATADAQTPDESSPEPTPSGQQHTSSAQQHTNTAQQGEQSTGEPAEEKPKRRRRAARASGKIEDAPGRNGAGQPADD